MSPFGKKRDDEDSAFETTKRELDAEIERLEALSVQQPANEVMTKAFNPDYDPRADTKSVDQIAAKFGPKWDTSTYSARLRFLNQREHDAQFRHLVDLIGEGVQVLQNAGLLWMKTQSGGPSGFTAGYATTRLGRAALQRNDMYRVLGGSTV
jgi:hypothetical protein